MSQAALDPTGPLAKVVAETVRIRAPGIDVRMAVADTPLPSASACPVIIPKVTQQIFSPFGHELLIPGLSLVPTTSL